MFTVEKARQKMAQSYPEPERPLYPERLNEAVDSPVEVLVLTVPQLAANGAQLGVQALQEFLLFGVAERLVVRL